jgi:hypothetical protein
MTLTEVASRLDNGEAIAYKKASPQRGKREGEKNGKENPEEVQEARIGQAAYPSLNDFLNVPG